MQTSSQFITSSTRASDRPRVINPHKSARFADIVAAIARTKKILVLSGDAALAGTGLLPLDHSVTVQHASDTRRVSFLNLIQETAKERPENLPSDRLAMYNHVMADRRVAARQAGCNVFLDFLMRICEKDQLTKCLTTSIDGLESQSSYVLANLVVPLYGDNRILRCASRGCKGVSEEGTIALDNAMLSRMPTPCNACTASYRKSNKQRRTGNEATRSLRPAVQHHISLSFTPVDMHIDVDDEDQGDEYVDQHDAVPSSRDSKAATGSSGKAPAVAQNAVGSQPKQRARPKQKTSFELPSIDRSKISDFHGRSGLLLIVGAQPKDPELLNLTRDLAMSVHESDGAVIYIDPVALRGVQHDHIDIQLQADVQETLGEVLQQMRRLREPYKGELEFGCTDADLWFDMIQNDIPVRLTEQEKPYEGATCCQCGCGITDYLAQCTKCSYLYCYRQVQHEDSDSEDSEDEDSEPTQGDPATSPRFGSSSEKLSDPAGAMVPNKETQGDLGDNALVGIFPYHEACIAFNGLSTSPRPPLAEAARSFICPDCWNHQESGLYPHYVRPIARESVEMKKPAWPRMAMVVYYVEQFWPQTKHLMSLTAGRWKQLGWECILEPVKLQHLDEKEDVFKDLHWEKGTYQVVAVYITHGLAGEQGYQLNNSQALRPAEMLTHTLRVARKALACASSSSVFIFSCGHPLHQPSLVDELRNWVNCETSPKTLIGCLNKKLSPVYMFILLSKLTQALADETADPVPMIRKMWLRDSIAFSHSDLLCLAKGRPAELWLYAPFQSRPLGRPLPSLLNVCSCSVRRDGDGQGRITKRERKVWKVEHNAAPGRDLRKIKVKARCQACRQTWLLPQETMDGQIIRVSGVYGAIVPYFPITNSLERWAADDVPSLSRNKASASNPPPGSPR